MCREVAQGGSRAERIGHRLQLIALLGIVPVPIVDEPGGGRREDDTPARLLLHQLTQLHGRLVCQQVRVPHNTNETRMHTLCTCSFSS